MRVETKRPRPDGRGTMPRRRRRIGTLRFLGDLVRTTLKANLALRGAFWLQAAFMALNNLVFFTVWWIFFDAFEEVRGWRIGDMAALYGTVATAFGLTVVFAGGVRDLALRISEGDLDALLTQPRSVLLQAVASRSWAAGWGDMLSGVGLLVVSGVLSPASACVAPLAIAISASVLVSTGVLLGASAFWLGRTDMLARQLLDYLVTFSLYPAPIFGGALRVLLFTVIPAGFVGHLPVALLRDLDGPTAAAALGGAAVYALLAAVCFRRGLATYASGNQLMGRA